MSTLYLFLSFPESKCIYLGFSMFEAWCCVMISRRIVEPRWAWCDETRLRYESHEKNKNSVGKHLLTTLAPPVHSGGQTHSCLRILSRLHWLIRDLIKINITKINNDITVSVIQRNINPSNFDIILTYHLCIVWFTFNNLIRWHSAFWCTKLVTRRENTPKQLRFSSFKHFSFGWFRCWFSVQWRKSKNKTESAYHTD